MPIPSDSTELSSQQGEHFPEKWKYSLCFASESFWRPQDDTRVMCVTVSVLAVMNQNSTFAITEKQ
jgi:hypothetical protein